MSIKDKIKKIPIISDVIYFFLMPKKIKQVQEQLDTLKQQAQLLDEKVDIQIETQKQEKIILQENRDVQDKIRYEIEQIQQRMVDNLKWETDIAEIEKKAVYIFGRSVEQVVEQINMLKLNYKEFIEAESENTRIDVLKSSNELEMQLCKVFDMTLVLDYMRKSCNSNRGWSYVGGLQKIFESITFDDTYTLENYANAFTEDKENLFVTNPTVTYRMLETMKKENYDNHIKSNMIFLMPYLPSTYPKVFVVWGKEFGKPEKDADNRYFKWNIGCENESNIIIFNRENNYKRIMVEYTIASLDTEAEIRVQHGATKAMRVYSLKKGWNTIREEMLLEPYCNPIYFCYLGKTVSVNGDNRVLKYSVHDFTIVNNGDGQKISGMEVYENDVNEEMTVFLPVYRSDTEIRSILHKNAFFEVEKYALTKKEMKKLETTRYDYKGDVEGKIPFYVYEGTKNIETGNQAGVAMYVAKRRGENNELNAR